MQVIDVIILLMLGMGAVVGLKRGFFKQTVQSIGGILTVVLAFTFREPLADFLFGLFPAFNFNGLFNGISSLNILVYEVIAFMILLVIFGIIFRFVLMLASLIENVLDATIILAIPSKILGAVMGLVEAYVIIYIVLFILTLPVFNISLINQSKYKDKILSSTPIMSNLANKTVTSFNSIYALKDEFKTNTDRLQLDKKVLKILIDNNIISADRAAKLYEDGKLNTK